MKFSILWLCFGLTVMLVFQNCGDARKVLFGKKSDGGIAAEPVVLNFDEPPPLLEQDSDEIAVTTEDGEEKGDDKKDDEIVVATKCDDEDKDKDKDKDEDDDDDDDDEDEDKGKESEVAAYVCILAGNGNSLHLKYDASRGLASDQSVPQSVCLSKSACEELVSTKFAVKQAKKAGYCSDKNPSVVALSDEQIADLL